MTNKKLFCVLILFLMLLATSMLSVENRHTVLAAPEVLEKEEFLNGEDEKTGSLVFLPIITIGTATPTSISGQVTLNGNPYGGITIELYLFDSYGDINLYKTTTTHADGVYQFVDIEPLETGEDYIVYFPNAEMNSNCLGWWETSLISPLTFGQTYNVPVFDVANVQLVSPAPGATTTIPTTFHWNARPFSPDDDYELNLLDWETDYYMWWTDPTLGYTSSYTLTGLPSGLEYNYNYGWALWIYNENGSGVSYYVQRIQFSNSGKSSMDNNSVNLQKRFVDDKIYDVH